MTVRDWLGRYERFWDANLGRLKALVEAEAESNEREEPS